MNIQIFRELCKADQIVAVYLAIIYMFAFTHIWIFYWSQNALLLDERESEPKKKYWNACWIACDILVFDQSMLFNFGFWTEYKRAPTNRRTFTTVRYSASTCAGLLVPTIYVHLCFIIRLINVNEKCWNVCVVCMGFFLSFVFVRSRTLCHWPQNKATISWTLKRVWQFKICDKLAHRQCKIFATIFFLSLSISHSLTGSFEIGTLIFGCENATTQIPNIALITRNFHKVFAFSI